jgi:hypothetical protein
MIRIGLVFLSTLLIGAPVNAQSPRTPLENAGPANFLIIVGDDIVTVVIESPMANYGVDSDLEIPPENHGVPKFQDYNDLRAELSRAINPEIEIIEGSVGSKFAFDQTAACKYDEGSESIFKENGEWVLTFSIDFLCLQSANLKSVSINLFDFPGFTTGTATVENGDLVVSYELDGSRRKVDLW